MIGLSYLQLFFFSYFVVFVFVFVLLYVYCDVAVFSGVVMATASSSKLSPKDSDLCVIALQFFRKSVERAARSEADEDVKRIRERQIAEVDRVIALLKSQTLDLS